jgi:hypothetical protein
MISYILYNSNYMSKTFTNTLELISQFKNSNFEENHQTSRENEQPDRASYGSIKRTQQSVSNYKYTPVPASKNNQEQKYIGES